MKNKDGSKTFFRGDHIDYETGEVKTSYTVSKEGSEPEFVKLYLADIVKLHGLSGITCNVLNILLRRMDYENLIRVQKDVKQKAASELGITVSSVENVVLNLVKTGILERQHRGVYFANPFLFGRGKWQDIKQMRLSVTYDENGRLVTVERE